MKNKFSIIILLAIITVSLTGCSKYEKDESYDTDLYGSYNNSLGEKESSYFSQWEYTLNKDNTYEYTSSEIQNGETTENNTSIGTISSIEKISNSIDKITFDSGIIKYKYKNMLGKIFFEEIPNKKTFDLTIPTPSDNWAGSYPNAANVFDKNGYYHSCLDITNCEDTEDNHVGLYYKYICKNSIIYFIDPSVEGMNWQILYYIVEDGLFAPELYKEEK